MSKSDRGTRRTSTHWADRAAERIIREKGDKELFVCASGITPSGTVHIGNFREIISVELVVRALRDRGRRVRFIYSWDDYDVFRKVPANMPEKEMLERYLRKPITLTPDPYGEEESFARRNESEMEKLLPVVGVKPEYIYQAEKYRNGVYAEGMRMALERRETIRGILNAHRRAPLSDDWWPVSVFCGSCGRDTTRVTGWDGAYGLTYSCVSCGREETIDLRETGGAKLFWRVDWPMRWAFEGVDFEPAGKDHHSEGGSFDTAERIVREVYGAQPPVSFQYDFIGIKGRGGKISSSTGEVVSLRDVLEIYQPEVIRYLFAGTRPNSEFAISFDLDVIKNYEDYDRTERIYFGEESVSEKRVEKERRVYELSQVDGVPERMPFQMSFRHLCSIVQIHGGDADRVLEALADESDGAPVEHLRARVRCAWSWTQTYAPESYRFRLKEPADEPVLIGEAERVVLTRFRQELAARFENLEEKTLSELIYTVANEHGMEPKQFFQLLYRVLIGKERGPRLAGFLLNIGRQRVLARLEPYTQAEG